MWSFACVLESLATHRQAYDGAAPRDYRPRSKLIAEGLLQPCAPAGCFIAPLLAQCAAHVPDERPRFGEIVEMLNSPDMRQAAMTQPAGPLALPGAQALLHDDSTIFPSSIRNSSEDHAGDQSSGKWSLVTRHGDSPPPEDATQRAVSFPMACPFPRWAAGADGKPPESSRAGAVVPTPVLEDGSSSSPFIRVSSDPQRGPTDGGLKKDGFKCPTLRKTASMEALPATSPPDALRRQGASRRAGSSFFWSRDDPAPRRRASLQHLETRRFSRRSSDGRTSSSLETRRSSRRSSDRHSAAALPAAAVLPERPEALPHRISEDSVVTE